MDKAWTHDAAASFSFAGAVAKLKNAATVNIPVGYQDESGFYKGVKTDADEIKWPATW